MALRLDEPNLWNTERLLEQILVPLMKDDARVSFLCDPTQGKPVLQRLRVMMSRKRAALERQGKRVKRFRLNSSIHSETHDGKRHDCVIVWKSVNEVHTMSEELEDILSHG